jgi:hypothetical protein
MQTAFAAAATRGDAPSTDERIAARRRQRQPHAARVLHDAR